MVENLPGAALIALGTVLGAAVGSLMNAGGALIEHHQSKKANFCEVLFDLLRIWDALFSLYCTPTPKEVAQTVSRAITERYPQAPEQEIKQTVKQLPARFVGEIDEHCERVLSLKFEDWSAEEYLSSIAKIRCLSPVLSFKIANRGRLGELINTADRFFEDMDSKDALEGLSEGGHSRFKEQIARHLIDDLEGDIKTVARKSGFLQYLKTLWIIRKIKTRRRLSNPKQLDKAVDLMEKWLKVANPDMYDKLLTYK